MSEFLLRGVHHCMGIKDFSPKQIRLYEYSWDIVARMVMIGEVRSGPDIWPETFNQGTGTEEMILTTWYKEAMKQNRMNPQQYHLIILSANKACYASYTSSY